jgi:hypothetical protein
MLGPANLRKLLHRYQQRMMMLWLQLQLAIQRPSYASKHHLVFHFREFDLLLRPV